MGDKHLKLWRADSEVVSKPGETIIETDSALDVEKIINKYAFGDV
jgi:phospholipid/cholesterol/gamma-HCH transport system substrate-binding protein